MSRLRISHLQRRLQQPMPTLRLRNGTRMKRPPNTRAFEATVREPASILKVYLWATDAEHARQRIQGQEQDDPGYDYASSEAVDHELLSGPTESEEAEHELLEGDQIKRKLDTEKQQQNELLRLLGVNDLEHAVAVVRLLVKDSDVEA